MDLPVLDEARRRARPPVAKTAFDETQVERQLEAARAAHEDDKAFRGAAVEIFRSALEHARREARAALEGGGR